MTRRSFSHCIISGHALFEMKRRGLDERLIRSVLQRPEQYFEIKKGRIAVQSRLSIGGKQYLVRVFIDIDRHPAEVVTAYRTSKILKYWRRDI